MNLTALAVVFLAVGIVLGSALRDAPFEASADPPTQQRNEQVVIFAQGEELGGPHIAADATEYDALAQAS